MPTRQRPRSAPPQVIEAPDRDIVDIVSNTPAETWTDRKATAKARKAAYARQVSGRKRYVDPCTCERDYTHAEMEFILTIEAYKRSSGRMFPTWAEVLEIVQGLGYEKSGG